METIKLSKTNKNQVIQKAVKSLKKGGMVVYPTETCYGIGVDATDKKAVEKLLEYKAKREGKPLSVAVTDEKMAKKYVETNETAQNLYKNFLPGPITVVSKGKNKVAQKVESEIGTLGIRIPDYSLILKIVEKFGKPITATSANASYKKRPYEIKDILENTSKKQQSLIDLIIDAGKLPANKPSTVVDTTLNEIQVLRKGDLKFKEKTANKIISNSEEETRSLAKTLLSKYADELKNKCLIFALQGELGTGKTVFAKGVGQFLDIRKSIVSPTFVIQREYPYQKGRLKGKFIHIDTWRMLDEEEFKDLKIEKLLKPSNIILIEWAEKIPRFIEDLAGKKTGKAVVILMKLKHLGETKRKIEFG